MIHLIDGGVCYENGKLRRVKEAPFGAERKTMAYKILSSHNVAPDTNGKLRLKFDEIASHDITYVGIIQTAKASGLDEFPLPYVLTNCHNSLCAVGGTVNEDDHAFGLSAAKKYGGVYVPPHLAVIHQYMREMRAFSGAMILGSDSHTRYGALGALAIGEGGPELVKQLLNRTYDIDVPKVVAVHLKGRLRRGVGPHDVALALIKETFKCGFVKNKILEFVGGGIKGLSMDMRNGIDVMTTETACLSSVWETDEKTFEYYSVHGRPQAYKPLHPDEGAYYDGAIEVDLSSVEPMIALPFHPSNAYTIKDFLSRPYELLKECEEAGNKLLPDGVGNFKLTDKIVDGKVYVDQGVIAGCAGGSYENIAEAAEIIGDNPLNSEAFVLNVYPSSQPVYKGLIDGGYASKLIADGAILKTAFCGPCFGAGDVPRNNGLSVRHTTRNFESREGSKPKEGQLAAVALMDARSIAATAANGGAITAATDVNYKKKLKKYRFDDAVYKARVFAPTKADKGVELVYGPNITDWPKINPLKKHLVLKVASVLTDAVTTTDELIPSGETSSYRSNPLRLAEFALSRKDPDYVGRAKSVAAEGIPSDLRLNTEEVSYGSVICAVKPGDGSAREQAASCQRVLGGAANIACEYATKRYRSNLINWGMIPFICDKDEKFSIGETIVIKNADEFILSGKGSVAATVYGENQRTITLKIEPLTESEKQIILSGCLINYYNKRA